MRLGLVIYGNLDIITGGFIFDKLVVEYLRRQGDEVEILALPWQPYALGLFHNAWAGLGRRLRQGRFDAVIQDELAHPSLFWLNQRLKPHIRYPIISLVHLLRSTEERPVWQNRLYRWRRTPVFAIGGRIHFHQPPHPTFGGISGGCRQALYRCLFGRRPVGWLDTGADNGTGSSSRPAADLVSRGSHPQERAGCAPAGPGPAQK